MLWDIQDGVNTNYRLSTHGECVREYSHGSSTAKACGDRGLTELQPSTTIVERSGVMHGSWPRPNDGRRHMIQRSFARARHLVHLRDLCGLFAALFVRIAVLLQPTYAVLHLGPAEPREQVASLDDADVHDGGVEPL